MEKFSLLRFLKSPNKDDYFPEEKNIVHSNVNDDKNEALSMFFKNHERRKNGILKNLK